ncbi:MAG: hypothetical protein AAF664_16060 [Planctomycetota bacterium]
MFKSKKLTFAFLALSAFSLGTLSSGSTANAGGFGFYAGPSVGVSVGRGFGYTRGFGYGFGPAVSVNVAPRYSTFYRGYGYGYGVSPYRYGGTSVVINRGIRTYPRVIRRSFRRH